MSVTAASHFGGGLGLGVTPPPLPPLLLLFDMLLLMLLLMPFPPVPFGRTFGLDLLEPLLVFVTPEAYGIIRVAKTTKARSSMFII